MSPAAACLVIGLEDIAHYITAPKATAHKSRK